MRNLNQFYKFPSAVISLTWYILSNFMPFSIEQTEMNLETGEPLEELAPVTKQWCKELGLEVSTVKDVLDGPSKQVIQKC